MKILTFASLFVLVVLGLHCYALHLQVAYYMHEAAVTRAAYSELVQFINSELDKAILKASKKGDM